MKTKMNMRYAVVKDIKYLRADDVAEFIRELAASEETDVRNRLNEAAENIQGRGTGH